MERVNTNGYEWRIKVASAMSGIALLGAGCSTPSYEIDASSNQPIVTAPELCPDIEISEPEEPNEPEETPDPDEESAEDLHPDPPKADELESDELFSNILTENMESEVSPFSFEKRIEMTLPDSGLDLHIFSDGDISVDANEMNELFHRALYMHDTIRDPDIRALYGCYKENIIDNRLFAGENVFLFVPSESSVCITGFSLGSVNEDTHCDKRGFAIPKVEVRAQDSFWNPVTLSFSAYPVFISSGRHDKTVAEQELAEVMSHEVAHLYDWLHDMPIQLTAIEQRAYYMETKVSQFYDKNLPTPIEYVR